MNITVTGDDVKEVRARLKLSREAFAQRTGLTPGAVWRIENKNSFKTGEVEKLTPLVEEVAEVTAAQLPPEPPSSSPVTVTVPVPDSSPQDDLTDPIASVLPPGFTAVIDTTPLQESLASVRPEPQPLNLPELSPYERFLQDGIRRYSNSEIQTFKRCRRKWYLGYYLGYTPKMESPTGAAAVGGRVHRALRWHYHPDPKQRLDPRDALEQLILIDQRLLREHYAPDYVPLSVETEFRKDADLERVMIAGYVEWLAENGSDADFVVTGAEEYVEVALPTHLLRDEKEIRLTGKLDARIRRVSDGARMFIDHKTVAAIDAPTRLLVINEQMKMYLVIERLLALSQEGERVDGAIFNMLRRCKRTVKANPPFYHRVEVRHNPIAIENFMTQLGAVITEIEKVRDRLDSGEDFRNVIYPTPAQDCVWSCNFLSISTMMDDGSHWRAMLDGFFQKGDPSSYYVKKNDIDSV